MNSSRLFPSARAMLLLDVAMAVWVVAWIGLGVAIGINVSHLTTLSRTVATDGRAVENIAGTLSNLSSLPFVGGSLGHTAGQIRQAGASAVASGNASISTIHTLAWLLGIAVALLPSVPVFGFYVPARVSRAREARALRRALREHGGDPRFQTFLAERAVASLSYRRLRDMSDTWRDVDAERDDRLAAAELHRLGIDPGNARGGSRRRH